MEAASAEVYERVRICSGESFSRNRIRSCRRDGSVSRFACGCSENSAGKEGRHEIHPPYLGGSRSRSCDGRAAACPANVSEVPWKEAFHARRHTSPRPYPLPQGRRPWKLLLEPGSLGCASARAGLHGKIVLKSAWRKSTKACLVWTIITRWYQGRNCVYCHKPFKGIHWHDHPPALVDYERKTVQWDEIPAEKLQEALGTHLPVCWSCHIAETFRREHPELVVDRPAH